MEKFEHQNSIQHKKATRNVYSLSHIFLVELHNREYILSIPPRVLDVPPRVEFIVERR